MKEVIGSVAAIALATIAIVWLHMDSQPKSMTAPDNTESWDNVVVNLTYSCYYKPPGSEEVEGKQEIKVSSSGANRYAKGLLVQATETITVLEYLTECK